MSWSDAAVGVTVGLATVSTVAACVAAVYGWRAVRDAREFHAEQDRHAERDRLLALIQALAELTEAAAHVAPPASSVSTIPLMRALHQRFAAEYEASGIPLLKCQVIADFTLDRSDGIHAAGRHLADMAELAFLEVRAAIAAHRQADGLTAAWKKPDSG